jgi:hypothetical protein
MVLTIGNILPIKGYPMRDLTLGELQEIKKKIEPEYLRNCAASFGIVTTYMPALLSMAEKYLMLSAEDRIKNGYSVVLNGDIWSIIGPHGFKINLGNGLSSRDTCKELVNRLNGLL